MELRVYYRSICIASAWLAIISFCLLVLAAVSAYPTPFSPFSNYLSDLGSSECNPAGARFFNAGCMITGVLTILFYAGLSQWGAGELRMLAIASVPGVFSGLALVLVGVFSEDTGKLHSIVASAFFISLILSILCTGFTLRKRASFKPVCYYGIVIALSGFLYLGSYLIGQPVIIAEWATVAGALGWIGVIAYYLPKLPGTGEKSD